MDAKTMTRVKKAIRQDIAELDKVSDLFGNTSLGYKNFNVLYCAGFAPKCTETVTVVVVAVKHKVVDEGFNVSVFEVYLRDNGEARAVYDGRAIVDFENKKILRHTVGYGSFDKEHADYFLDKMLKAQ